MASARAHIGVRAGRPPVPVSRPEKREETVPADFAPDPAREPHDADNQAPAGDVDQVPQAPPTFTTASR